MELGLRGRTVLVTGGSNGIGSAVARAFGREGAHVVVTYRTGEERARAVVAEVEAAGGTGAVHPYALEEPESAELLVRDVVAQSGRLDVVVGNAVRWWGRGPGGFETLPAAEAEAVVADNLLGAVRLCRAVAPALRAGGAGRLVLMSTNLAVDGLPGGEYYTAAKAGLHGLARSLAWSLGPAGVLVNVVLPGLTMTDRNAAGFPPHLRQMEVERTPTGRLVLPDDVANTVLYLCSQANRAVTGAVVPVTGGR